MSSAPLGIGIIGCGHWGLNHLRVFDQLENVDVLMACDTSPARQKLIAGRFHRVRLTNDYREVLSHPQIDAVIIATPASSHFTVAREAMEQGKDVLCEKPLAVLPEECRALTALAERHQRVLMVGHVYLFNEAILTLKNYLREGELGPLVYASSVRSNCGPIRDDVSVVYDLACHDVAVFNYLFDAQPIELAAHGVCRTRPNLQDVVFISLEYPGGVLVHIHVSWLGARKIRHLTLVGEQKAVEWNELAPDGPVRIMEKRPVGDIQYKDFGEFQILSRTNPLVIPSIGLGEPLEAQASHFVQCVRQRKHPHCDGRQATDVVETLWAIQQLLDQSPRDRRLKSTDAKETHSINNGNSNPTNGPTNGLGKEPAVPDEQHGNGHANQRTPVPDPDPLVKDASHGSQTTESIRRRRPR